MKAEIHFFMTVADADAFIKRAEGLVDSIEQNEESSQLNIGDCQIDYSPSVMQGSSLLTGSISIDSGGIDDGCADYVRANKIYKDLRKWIKKEYYSRLCTWNEGEDKLAKSARSRDYWLGPDAKLSVESDSDLELRLASTSTVLFGLAPEMNVMGDIKPKEKKKRR